MLLVLSEFWFFGFFAYELLSILSIIKLDNYYLKNLKLYTPKMLYFS